MFSAKKVFSSKCSPQKKRSPQSVIPQSFLPKKSALFKVFSSKKSVLLLVFSAKKVFSSKCSPLKKCSSQSVLLRYHHGENTSTHCALGTQRCLYDLRTLFFILFVKPVTLVPVPMPLFLPLSASQVLCWYQQLKCQLSLAGSGSGTDKLKLRPMSAPKVLIAPAPQNRELQRYLRTK